MPDLGSPRGPNAKLIGEPGSRHRLETPALVLDLDVLDHNIADMAAHAQANGYALRPCFKVCKSVEIARRQVAAGALGVCCATLAEAEVSAAAGIPGVVLFSTVVTPDRLERVAALNASGGDFMVVTDDLGNVADLGKAARRSGRELAVMADYAMDGGRTGALDAAQTVRLAQRIADTDGLRYAGLQGYNGRVLTIPRYDDRAAASLPLVDKLREVVAELEAAGLAPEIVSGSGTGTHDIDCAAGVFTEIQVGTYALMDVNYSGVELRRDNPAPFGLALSVSASVISSAGGGYAITDGGAKEIDGTFGTLEPLITAGAPEGSRYQMVGDDLGRIELPAGAPPPAVGDRVTLIPPHAWQTVPLYPVFHCVSGDTLVDIWPVDAQMNW
jgi:3-hydroxy-D-aspartate aldolase